MTADTHEERLSNEIGSGSNLTPRFRDDIALALTALAAERDRADRAEAALAEAWDEGYDASATDWENGGPGNPNPYRSEATA